MYRKKLRRIRRVGRKRRGRRIVKFRLPKVPNYKTEMRLTLTCTADITYTGTNGAGGGYEFVAFSIPTNYPLQYFSNGTWNNFSAATAPFAVTAKHPVFTRLLGSNAIFDMYKVIGLKVRHMPMATQQLAIVPGTTPNYSELIYHYFDDDDYSLLTSESSCLNSGLAGRSFSNGKSSTFYQKAKNKGWFNTSNYNTAPTSAVGNQLTVNPINSYGATKIGIAYRSSGNTLMGLGTIYCEWDIIFKDLRNQAS